MEKDKTKDKNLVDADKVFRKSDDLDIVMNRRSLDDAMNIVWSKITEENIREGEDVKMVLKRDPEDISFITEDDFEIQRIGEADNSEFSLEDVMDSMNDIDETPTEEDDKENDLDNSTIRNTDTDSDYDYLSLGSRVNGLEKSIYEETTMKEAFGLYGYLWGILYVVIVYLIAFLPSSYNMIPNLVNNQYTGVLVGLFVVGGLAVQQLLLWYPRNLNPIKLKVKYNNDLSWFITLVGGLLLFVYPVSFIFGYGEMLAFHLLYIIPVTALFADTLMISDEVDYYKNLDKETENDDELITHEHLPDDGLYPFNTKRRAFLWSTVTASIPSVFMLFASVNFFTQIAFITVILMPSMVMAQYLRKRSDMDNLARN